MARSRGWIASTVRPKSRKSTGAAPARKMPTMSPGAEHRETGQVTSHNSMRCECGGITGNPNTPGGGRKIVNHYMSSKHQTWENGR